MSSFSFPPARGASGRPAAQRTQSARASPYQRPMSTSSPSTSDGKWTHDLFGEDSNRYTPSVNSQALKSKLRGWTDPAPSASLRPFGAATPAAQPLVRNAVAQAVQPQQQARQQEQQQLVAARRGVAQPVPQNQARFGIKGTSNAAALQRKQQEARQKAEREYAELVRLRKEEVQKREEKVKIAQEEEKGFVVQVEGLVQGTSAEDVQTAFGSYGEISYCFIVDPNSQNLAARLTFTKHFDAAQACLKLDGAIADGRPLRVQQTSRTPVPPVFPPLPSKASVLSTAGAAAPSPSAPRVPPAGPRTFAGVPTGPKGRSQVPKQPIGAISPAIPSKMYADAIESAESAALCASASSNAMDVDMAPPSTSSPLPTGPRRGRGRGAAAAALPAAAKPAPPAPSLAQRLGQASGKQGQQQGQQQGGSLAARLGVANGAANGAGGGGKKKGKGGGGAGGQRQPGLLARLG
ncbi:hypothetical protein JCM8547_000881 [Rhodosporidiobolus lusitaniae]